MDKQKQIRDKLIKVIKKQCICCNGNDCDKCCYDGDDCVEERLSDAILDSNAIIPENAVVVPDMADKDFYAVEKSEWDKMVQGTKDIIREREEKARKETAEKFAELAKAKLNEWLKDNEDNDGKIDFGIAEIELIGVKSLEGEVISESLIDEICKEITEGEKEISNETV